MKIYADKAPKRRLRSGIWFGTCFSSNEPFGVDLKHQLSHVSSFSVNCPNSIICRDEADHQKQGVKAFWIASPGRTIS